MADALAEPCVHAARARGCSVLRAVWRHAFPLSLRPLLSIYGVIVGSVLSGSFAVEFVTSWPGLGALMYEALVARDLYLAAGCATVGAALLAGGVLAADLALAFLDPRVPAAA
jgi:peptide/nickel transport system permease protein